MPSQHPFLARGVGDCMLLVLPGDVDSPPPLPGILGMWGCGAVGVGCRWYGFRLLRGE